MTAPTASAPTAPVHAGLKEIREFFGYPTLAEFAAEWRELDKDAQDQIKSGLGDGSLTY